MPSLHIGLSYHPSHNSSSFRLASHLIIIWLENFIIFRFIFSTYKSVHIFFSRKRKLTIEFLCHDDDEDNNNVIMSHGMFNVLWCWWWSSWYIPKYLHIPIHPIKLIIIFFVMMTITIIIWGNCSCQWNDVNILFLLESLRRLFCYWPWWTP